MGHILGWKRWVRHLFFVVAVAAAFGVPAGSAAAVEIKPLMKKIIFKRIEIGKEIHFTDGEVRDGTRLAALAATKFPKAAPFVGLVIDRIQRENKGNGVIVEVLWTGHVVGTRPR